MHARISKEFRLLRPALLLSALLAAAALFLHDASKVLIVFASAILGASIFGGEFGHGTLSQLLAQPIDRRRIWYEKMRVLAITLAPLVFVALSIHDARLALLPLCAFCTAPLFTLLGRSTVGAVVFSMTTPFLIYLTGSLVTVVVFGGRNIDRWVSSYFAVVLPLYCAVLYYLGYRRFQRLELADVAERQLRLAGSLPSIFDRLLERLCPPKHRALAALIGKELRFQHNALTLFLIFGVIQILMIIHICLAHPAEPVASFLVPLLIYTGLVPFVIGASAIAEEHQLGTHAWHLTLPVSIRTQWLVKAGVAFLYTVLLGFGVPVMWTLIGNSFVVPALGWMEPLPIVLSCASLLLLTAIAFYASSLSRDTLRALIMGAGLCVALTFIVATLGQWVEKTPQLRSGELLQPLVRHLPIISAAHFGENIILPAPVVCLFILLLLGSFRHFRTLDHSPRRIWSNVIFVFLPPIFLFFLLLSLGLATKPAVQ